MNQIKMAIRIALLITSLNVWSQMTISGTVTDSDSMQPLLGASVIVKGTTVGTTTDFDGNYTIEASSGDVLVFSYIGYISKEIAVETNTISVTLAPDTTLLDEVVVIGYGTAQKKDLTGAVDLISSEDFNQGPVFSPQQLIQGKIAGVSITSNSGAPGEGSNILIRGTGSLSLNSNPLIVVDGIPLNDGGVGGTRNPLNLINPNDIETFTVLKDASATAIYGSRAANGVVIITTKKGKSGDFKFNLRTSTALSEATNLVDVLSAEEFRAVVNGTGDQELIDLLGSADTNWQEQIYNTAFTSDHSLSATGMIGNFPLRASIGYTDQEGILKGDKMQRTTAGISVTPKFLDDALRIEANVRMASTKNIFADRGAIGSAISMDPTQPIYDVNSPYFAFTDNQGVDTGFFAWLDGGAQNALAPVNPLAILQNINDEADVFRFIGNLKVDYDLPFLSGLTATVNAAWDESNSDGFRITNPNIPTATFGFDGAQSNYTQNATNGLFDAYLNYNKGIGKANVSATAGYSYQKFEFDNSSTNTDRILNNDGTLNEEASLNQSFIDKSRNVLLSYFGRVNLEYDDRFLLTATLRADASSKLNPNDRWGYFPSVAVAWNIQNEKFLENSIFNQLKLRAGYGEVGNVNGLGDYNFLTRYNQSTQTAQYQFGSSFFQTYRPEPINENLKWEVGNTLNVGLDFGLFQNRVYGTVNAYLRKTTDLIQDVTVDPFTNFGNTIPANLGDMENRGIEFELGLVPVRTQDIEWSINYNVAYNENEITRLSDPQEVGGISGGVGNSIQIHRIGGIPNSFFVFKQIYDAAGQPIEGAYADLNGDNQINGNDRYYFKSPFADFIMGLTTNFRYKNFDLVAVSRANIGNYIYDNLASNANLVSLNSGQGFTRNINADYLNTRFQQFTEVGLKSDYFVKEASFFRLDNVTLGYTVKQLINKQPTRIFLSGNNLLTITDYDGVDPEINGGIDNNFYPRPITILLGLDINF